MYCTYYSKGHKGTVITIVKSGPIEGQAKNTPNLGPLWAQMGFIETAFSQDHSVATPNWIQMLDSTNVHYTTCSLKSPIGRL